MVVCCVLRVSSEYSWIYQGVEMVPVPVFCTTPNRVRPWNDTICTAAS